MTSPLLEATGIAKHYGAVVALRSAALTVLPGEVHALMGANGAGKSTLVKILTGTVPADGGTISIRGEERVIRSAADARRAGVVSVYQDPSLLPDLTVADNLRLTSTAVPAFREWMSELGIPDIDLADLVRELPLPTLRIIDLARALAAEPDALILDETTAALPADLTERALEVVGRQRASGRSVIFISHRLIEISAICDRATVLRDGRTVGVVGMSSRGAERRIVDLMLGEVPPESVPAPEATPGRGTPAAAAVAPDGPPRLAVRGIGAAHKLHDVSFELRAGEVLGVVALEGQGQEELFEILAGSRRSTGGTIEVDGRPMRFRHPADAIREGLVYVPANRLEALLPQRSVRENVALPLSAPIRRWGLIPRRQERVVVDAAIERLQIDIRAQSEVRRLSGGNQQKVTIARWVAMGVRTLLCFDPTRGIDIRTKRQIYVLLRELAAAGSAVLLYTSELAEIQLACDRAVVIFGGRVVGELSAAEADEPTLLRAAYDLPADAPMPEEVAEAAVATGSDA
jgi:ribose transport system ATP-binding protein